MADQNLPRMGYYARITLTVVAVLVVARAAWTVRSTLLLVLVAAVLAVGLDPAVRRLQRMHLSRGWAVIVIFVATVGFLVLFSLLVIPPLVREVRQLASDIPGYIDRLKTSQGWVGDLERKYHLSTRLKDITDRLPSVASSSVGKILGITKSVASVIFNLLTISILTIYFLLSLPKTQQGIERLFQGEHRQRNVNMFEESLHRVGGYVSGNIAVSIIAGVGAFVFLRIFGIPFAAALAMWVAIADLIPTVGATLGAVAAILVAFFSSITDGVATIVYFVIYQQVENYVIVPRVMKKAVDLSPAAVIVSVLIGGGLAGFAGALLALPLAAAAKVIVRDVWLRPRVEVPEPAPEDSVEAEPAPGAIGS